MTEVGKISDFASRIIFPNHNMAGYGHPYVIHAANLVSRKALVLQRVMVPPFQAAAQQQQQQQEPVRVAHEQVIDLVHGISFISFEVSFSVSTVEKYWKP